MNLRPVAFALLALAFSPAFSQVQVDHSGQQPGSHDPGAHNARQSLLEEAIPGARVSHVSQMNQGNQGAAPYGSTPGSIPQYPQQQQYPTPAHLMPQQGSAGPAQEEQPPADPNEGREMPLTAADREMRDRALWQLGASAQSMRQSGLSSGRGDRYMLSIAASTHPDDRRTLYRWKEWLPQFGVDPVKINFESRRLGRADFDRWASRFVWEACRGYSFAAPPACQGVGIPPAPSSGF